MTKRALLVFALVAGGPLAACNFLDIGGAGGRKCAPLCNGEYAVAPLRVHILRGDTARLTACVDYLVCVAGNTTGDVLATWTLPNPSMLRLLTGDSTATSIAAVSRVLVRGLGAGLTSVRVTAPTSGLAFEIAALVADSSAITTIDLLSQSADPRVNATKYLSVSLKDSAGNSYRARPTSVSVSDAGVLSASINALNAFGPGNQPTYHTSVTVLGIGAGTADLRVHFLGVTKSISVTVAP
jgi:hypothetical protein